MKLATDVTANKMRGVFSENIQGMYKKDIPDDSGIKLNLITQISEQQPMEFCTFPVFTTTKAYLIM